MAVRDLKPEDFRQVIDLYGYYREVDEDPKRLGREVGLALEKKPPSLADEFARFSEILKALERGDAVFKVAEAGGKLVGTCDIRRNRRRGFSHLGGTPAICPSGRRWSPTRWWPTWPTASLCPANTATLSG
ncbi:MAG: hypothetical protein ACP5KY_07515 [Thermoproteus sp.]